MISPTRNIWHFYEIVIILITISLSSCMKDDMRPITQFNAGSDGVFIVCEGNFMYSNSSLSYYNKSTMKVENNVFLKANGIPLGDVAQSLTIFGTSAYVVINNSGRIYEIDLNTFEYKSKITGLISPRQIIFQNINKAFISDLYSNSIYVVNPMLMTIIDTIHLKGSSNYNETYSSEQMVFYNDYLYVNSWSYDDKILKINTKNLQIIDTITVFKQPRKIVLDRNNKLWVLCDGGFDNSSFYGEAGIIKIDAETFKIEKSFSLGINSNPADMVINSAGDSIYFINRDVFAFHINTNNLPTETYIFSGGKNFHSLGIDPYNSDLYVSDAIDYMQSGVVYRYNSTGNCLDTIRTGIIPSSIVFK